MMELEIDRYRLTQVRAYLDFPIVVLAGYHVKLFSRMGDMLAAAIIKSLDRERLSDGDYLLRIVCALGAAFYAPDGIPVTADRRPEVTLVFLEWLSANVPREYKCLMEATIMKIKATASSAH